jgi:hypothetical protein
VYANRYFYCQTQILDALLSCETEFLVSLRMNVGGAESE